VPIVYRWLQKWIVFIILVPVKYRWQISTQQCLIWTLIVQEVKILWSALGSVYEWYDFLMVKKKYTWSISPNGNCDIFSKVGQSVIRIMVMIPLDVAITIIHTILHPTWVFLTLEYYKKIDLLRSLYRTANFKIEKKWSKKWEM